MTEPDSTDADGARNTPPKPETAEQHSGSADVSQGMNANLDPSLAPEGADQKAAQAIREQHQRNEDEQQGGT